MHGSSYFDFNDAADYAIGMADDVEGLRHALIDRLESVLLFLFPQGRIRSGKFYVGDIDGSPGKSLVVEMEGARRGLWFDFATGVGGDVFDAWALSRTLSIQSDFHASLMRFASGVAWRLPSASQSSRMFDSSQSTNLAPTPPSGTIKAPMAL